MATPDNRIAWQEMTAADAATQLTVALVNRGFVAADDAAQHWNQCRQDILAALPAPEAPPISDAVTVSRERLDAELRYAYHLGWSNQTLDSVSAKEEGARITTRAIFNLVPA